MGILKDFFGDVSSKSVILSLDSKNEIPAQISIKATPETEDLPTDMAELERAYKRDPIAFNSVNKAVQMIMASGYEIIANSEEAKKYFISFFNNIGNVGEDITFDEVLEAIFKYQMIYGNAFVEIVFNKKMDRIVDLVLVDPKRMDYAKDASSKIALDKYGKPVGYTLKLPYGVTAKGDAIPEEFKNKVSLGSDQIFMLPQRICHFKLYTVGDRFYGVGLIEPAYKSIIRKMNIEEAQTNSIYSRGTYPVIATVGDEQHEPGPADIQSALDILTKLKHDRYISKPYWVKVDPLEVKQSDIVDTTLNYLRMNETSSLGIPMAFASGEGEKTNRATLNNQQKMMEFTLNDIVSKTLSTIRKYILKRISYYNGISEIPKIKWGDIGAEEINEKANRLVEYTKIGILTPEEIKEYVKKLEDLE